MKLQSAKLEQSLENELLLKLEQLLGVQDVSYDGKEKIRTDVQEIRIEIPERVLSEFTNLITEEFQAFYSVKQVDKNVFDFRIRDI